MKTYRMILSDGRVFSLESRVKPKAWKSRLIRLAPYNTDLQGARFEVTQ